MSSPTRVLIVDDHEVFADALTVCLGDYPDLFVVGTATTAAKGLRLLELGPCDVMVLDLNLAGEDGLGVAREALRHHPRLGIVVATGTDSGEQILEAVQVGVRGWVPKTSSALTLVDAIRGVARGETRIPADLLAGVLVSISRGQRATLENVQGLDDLTG
ncbi:MAG TPA: response regulator transcription factor, partial [Pedococcus sp.]|nr:response regulator transcription factor [Pedococcus sp.]